MAFWGTWERSAIVLAVVLAGCVPAQQRLPPISADRPSVTDGVTTIPRGTAQLESGYTATCGGGEPCDHSVGEALLRLGLWSRTEARIALNSYEVEPQDGSTQRGFDDASLDFKIRLYVAPDSQIQLTPSTSLFVGTSVPTGNGDFGARHPAPMAKLAVDWFLGRRFDLAANAIIGAQLDDQGRYTQSGASVSLSKDFAEHLGGYFEWYALGGNAHSALSSHSLNAGLSFTIRRDFQVDARYGGAITGSDRNWFFGVGFARRWPR
ncbi:MAG TPA: transporter [Gemmatimonadaceae bacterium]